MKKLSKPQLEIGPAYDLVLADLFASLKKLKDKRVIKLGDLGTLTKKKQTLRSNLQGRKRVFLYYQVKFSASPRLKEELNKSL
jgi:nucleoid DNA-binding protein